MSSLVSCSLLGFCRSDSFFFDCRILSAPKARTILVNGAIRKGERLLPPSAFETLMRATFPTSSARVKVGNIKEHIFVEFSQDMQKIIVF